MEIADFECESDTNEVLNEMIVEESWFDFTYFEEENPFWYVMKIITIWIMKVVESTIFIALPCVSGAINIADGLLF